MQRARTAFAVLILGIAIGAVAFAQSGRIVIFGSTHWAPGKSTTSRDGMVEATLDKMGPPDWAYTVEGGMYPTCCTNSVQVRIEQVQIVSNFVPVECGNLNPKHKHVSTATAKWKPNTQGNVLEGPRDESTSMSFNINCDANNGTIYLLVDWFLPDGAHRGHSAVGPIPGPVQP